MTNEQIQQWAREAGIYFDGENTQLPLYVAKPEKLQAFATLVRNATLEEAAKSCEERILYWYKGSERADEDAFCAVAIRSMKS